MINLMMKANSNSHTHKETIHLIMNLIKQGLTLVLLIMSVESNIFLTTNFIY